MIQKDLFSFAGESNSLSSKPDSLVLELLEISCGKR